MRDHGRARAELAATADGPWFREFRIRPLLDVSINDERPDLLARAGVGEAVGRTRRTELKEHPAEELPPVIDWSNVGEAFAKQQNDLFAFLAMVRVEGRQLTEEERIDGYCAILCHEDWADGWDSRPFSFAAKEGSVPQGDANAAGS